MMKAKHQRREQQELNEAWGKIEMISKRLLEQERTIFKSHNPATWSQVGSAKHVLDLLNQIAGFLGMDDIADADGNPVG